MTFLQIFLAGLCLRAGWFAFNFIRMELYGLVIFRLFKKNDRLWHWIND